ncbi:MAG: HD domain-containing protein [Capsulimonadaceae bacterium]|nr:HD domain-containing protein [Capsulimonadaceae bacterium]
MELFDEPPSGPYISDLKPGMRLDGALFAVVDVKPVNAKGFEFVKVRLSDSSGSVDGIVTPYSDDKVDQLRGADVVAIWGDVDSRERYAGQVNVRSFSPQEFYDETRFVQPLPANHDAVIQRFFDVAATIADAPYRTLLDCVLTHMPEYFTACAAMRIHHAYRGGLVTHSTEVAEVCLAASQIFPALDRSLLITGALLHDVGKVREMEHGLRRGKYAVHGELVGHVVSGALLVRDFAGAAGLADVDADRLMHLILSHHARLDQGSPREPKTAEAWVLAMADSMSANVARCATEGAK